MSRVALDTSVLCHVVKPTPKRGQEAEHANAHRFVKEAERKHELCIPTPAFAEVLLAADERDAGVMQQQLEEGFTMLAYDLEAAARTAALLRGRKFDPNTKVKAKFDAQIAATALRWDATLCTTDDDQIALVVSHGGRAGRPTDLKDGDQGALF